MTDLHLLEMLCSRICHDLVGPVGALSNGVELLSEGEDDEDLRTQALELLEHSAAEARARLQAFRFAFGAGAGFGEQIAEAEVQRLAADLLARGRVTLNWPAAPRRLDKDPARLALNLVMMAVASLPRGGVLEVTWNEHGAMVTARHDLVRLDRELAAALTGTLEPEALSPHLAQAVLTARLAQRLGVRMVIAEAQGTVTFALSPA
ncbi:histidine phosphotransferase family protein [Zavarzinia sp. CC-PAN008]|uniref:histidine phosphotransferase family protein n=1 Tax=Zavarzinia sp. CC-PAN008 TaxID=3243332 RepID=UPI003F748DBA